MTSTAPTLIYIDGYGTNGDSNAIRTLREQLSPDFKVCSPVYNGSNPIEALRELDEAVTDAASASMVIAGLSLGGFFANYLARKYNRPAVLINPTLKPSIALAKFHKAQPILDAYVRLEEEESSFSSMPPRRVIVGLQDEIVEPADNGLAMQNIAEVTTIPMGHQLDPAFHGMVVRLVRDLAKEN